jgi:hypothetical protein
MDPLHLAISLGPLAVYLLLLGIINLRSHPVLVNGARDSAALGVAIGGLIVAGPVELFFPETVAFHMGAYVWLLLLALYGLSLTLFVLLMRPRLVIYNLTRDQLRPLLAQLVGELDRDARWAGDSLVIPKLGVQLYVEASPAMRIVQLAAVGPHQNYAGWRRLEESLAVVLRQMHGKRNSLGYTLVALFALLVTVLTLSLAYDPSSVSQSLRQMLRL